MYHDQIVSFHSEKASSYRDIVSIPSPGKVAILCVYKILPWPAAYGIQSISQLPNEEKVLIFSNTGFDVTVITYNEPVEIEL
jgi:hypothetical protein